MTESLIAYCDVLGTTSRVVAETFHPFEALDFAGPVALVAKACPYMRAAVFSDTVVLSCPASRPRDFVSTVSFMMNQWFADFLLVRGGIACGEVKWIEDPSIDRMFKSCSNLSMSRIYGRALIEALNMERHSGPGAALFIHDSAVSILHAADPPKSSKQVPGQGAFEVVADVGTLAVTFMRVVVSNSGEVLEQTQLD